MFLHYDKHLLSCLTACSVAQMIVELLPDCDLCTDLNDILDEQFKILSTYLEAKHYGSNALDNFSDRLLEKKIQIEVLTHAIKKRNLTKKNRKVQKSSE